MQLQDAQRHFSPAVFVRLRNRFETRGSLPCCFVDMPELSWLGWAWHCSSGFMSVGAKAFSSISTLARTEGHSPMNGRLLVSLVMWDVVYAS